MAWTRNNFSGGLVPLLLCAVCAGGLGGLRAAEPSGSVSPAFTRLDSLFLIAATGEPRFQAERDSCEKTLIALDTVTLGYLATRPRDQTPRQRHYVERLFTVMADSGRNPAPRRVLAGAVADAPSDTARAQWLYVGSRLGDPAFRAAALPWLASESEAVRRMAARVLGAYPHPDNLPLLWTGLDTLRELELHQRLWALDAHPPPRNARDWKRLTPLLADPDFYNRRKARDMLLRATDSSWTKLRAAMPKGPDDALRREWRLLALDARDGTGGRAFLEAEKAGMTGEERFYFGL